jgi:hypothetical protein
MPLQTSVAQSVAPDGKLTIQDSIRVELMHVQQSIVPSCTSELGSAGRGGYDDLCFCRIDSESLILSCHLAIIH